jgi:hypothetical protein
MSGVSLCLVKIFYVSQKKDIIRNCEQITLGTMKNITTEEVFIIRDDIEPSDL